MTACIDDAVSLDPAACRARARHYSVERMREDYERVYERLLAKQNQPHPTNGTCWR
jgi:hypothetical protein